ARAAAGGSGTPHGSQVMMELSYGIQLTPQLRIAPNLHYIVHPDPFNEPARQRDLPNALIAGMRVDWNL
ncbi:carbohydrate porin, partial [Stenotrophomonas sp. 3diitr2024]